MLLSREQTAASEAADYDAQASLAARKPFILAGVANTDMAAVVAAIADKLLGAPDRLSAVCEVLRAFGATLGAQRWPDSTSQNLIERTVR